MKQFTLTTSFAFIMISSHAFGEASMYCPENHAYIKLGMNVDQVIAACGQPLSQETSNQPLQEKVPMKQLIYNNQGTSTSFYGVWSLPTGNNGGAQLEIDVINNQVVAVRMNGNSTNASSICKNASIQTGTPVNQVYGACGSPSIINTTFINKNISGKSKPLIWTYQSTPYQPPFNLTFVDGQLQSID